MSINTTMDAKSWLTLILLSVLWGGSFFFVEVALTELDTLTIVFLRVLLAAVALWIFALATGERIPHQPSLWLAFLVMGLLNNALPFCLIVWGQTTISSGLASILNATTPLFSVLVCSLFLADERATPLKLLGVAIGFFGVVLMVGTDALAGIGINLWAQLAILGAALSYSLASVFGRRFKALGVRPVVAAAGQVTGASVVLAPLVFWLQPIDHLSLPGLPVVLSMLGIALLSTALAYIMFFRLLASSGATNVLLVTFLVPVSAIVLGALFLGESLQWIHYVGMALIALGLSAIDGRLWKQNKP